MNKMGLWMRERETRCRRQGRHLSSRHYLCLSVGVRSGDSFNRNTPTRLLQAPRCSQRISMDINSAFFGIAYSFVKDVFSRVVAVGVGCSPPPRLPSSSFFSSCFCHPRGLDVSRVVCVNKEGDACSSIRNGNSDRS